MINNNYFTSLLKLKDLFKRFVFSFIALTIYRFGTYLTIPGINQDILQHIANNYDSGFLGIFNMFSGGALGRMTIFALNVMPYILASIVIQLLSVSLPFLENIRQDGELGKRKINFYTRSLTIIFCIIQSIFITVGLQSLSLPEPIIVRNFEISFTVIAIITLTGGTVFLMWLGEQITVNGIGNGISLIIVTGILTEFPSAIYSFFSLGKVGGAPVWVILCLALFFVAVLWFIIYIEQSFRKITIQYPRRQVGKKLYQANSSYIPIKINMSGVIPPIFANALLMFPITLANFFPDSAFATFFALYLTPDKFFYIVLYILCIVFFCFFYIDFVFNVEETVLSLKKQGGFILGKRPGNDTKVYLNYVLKRITMLGAIYLSAICIIPEIIRMKYSIPFIIGGTSLLIIVNVMLDIFFQIQTYIITQNYSKFNMKF